MKKTHTIMIACMGLLASSCNQKDLCFDHWEHAPRNNYEAVLDYNPQWQLTYEGGTDWREAWDTADYDGTYESLLPGLPKGVRALVYNTDTQYDTYNLPPEGGRIGITVGEHEILFFNNDTEYIVFGDLNKAAEATATTRARTRSTYLGSAVNRDNNVHEYTVNPPDMLYSKYVGRFTGELSNEMQYIHATLQPLVFKYVVRFHFDYGIQYVRLARGALAGMALSVNLTDGSTSTDKATVLFDVEFDPSEIKSKYEEQIAALQGAGAGTSSRGEEEKPGAGCLTAIVTSFGAPGYPNPFYARADGPFGLNLEVRLGNGKIFNFDYDITEQMIHQPRGGVIDVYGAFISDEAGQEDSGAFDVDVEDWGPHEDIDIFNGNINNNK